MRNCCFLVFATAKISFLIIEVFWEKEKDVPFPFPKIKLSHFSHSPALESYQFVLNLFTPALYNNLIKQKKVGFFLETQPTQTRGKQVTLSITRTTIILAIVTLLFGIGFGVQTLIGGTSETNQQMPSGNAPTGNFGNQQNGASDGDTDSDSDSNTNADITDGNSGATATDTPTTESGFTTAVAA